MRFPNLSKAKDRGVSQLGYSMLILINRATLGDRALKTIRRISSFLTPSLLRNFLMKTKQQIPRDYPAKTESNLTIETRTTSI